MEGEAENPKKAKREKAAIALTLLALIAAAGTYWETHRMVTHGDVKDRPRLKIISSRASKQDDHFINVLLEIRNDGESGATLTEISSQPLTGTVEENTDNQACYDELRDAKPFIDPGGEDREELLKNRSRPVVLLVELPPHCMGRVNVLAAKINLTYSDPFKNVYEQHEYISPEIR
jgi:hypothetical protein